MEGLWRDCGGTEEELKSEKGLGSDWGEIGEVLKRD